MLIEAGMRCLAQGGITAFTIDNICREASASRGLVTHHFGSKDGLLAAIYAAMYDRLTAVLQNGRSDARPGPGPDLCALVESTFSPEVFNPASLKIWLALWGEIANNEALRQVHRQRYRSLLADVSEAVAAEAARCGAAVDADRIAVMFVALNDGLWLEQGIDPAMLPLDAAREACYLFLEAHLGPLPRPARAG
ncbi:MAG: TetR family transcriptional regulator C-terminal domain-containing protein [Proteobacteria bacterium]|nr:TetR family transcriptional regulator C-terminal domain-containing protein [Pseudomonadota bacterium]